MYVDMRAAYADLSADIKRDIEDAVAEHWMWHFRKLAVPQEFDKPTISERKALLPSYHTIVQIAPGGVGKTLYLASHVRRMIDMSEKALT